MRIESTRSGHGNLAVVTPGLGSLSGFLDESTGATKREADARRVATIGAVCLGIACGALFYIYCRLIYWSIPIADLPTPYLRHVAFNVLANAVVAIIVYRIPGGFTQRMNQSLFAAMLVHAALLLLILLTRQYYSRPLLFLSLIVSLATVAIVLAVVSRYRPIRIGVVPSLFNQEVWNWVSSKATVIDSPAANVRQYDVILVDWETVDAPAWKNLLSRATLSDRLVYHVAKFVEDSTGRVSLDHFEPRHVSHVAKTFYVRYVKRSLDILIVLAILPVALPLLGAAMLAIKLRMGGSVFFVQDRVGRGGEVFSIYKLRTMTTGDVQGEVKATSIGDKRITPLGRFLRRYRFDELPQLWNVLIGDMSFIGPRPEQPKLSAEYEKIIPGFSYRQALLPGLTGWAQIRTGYAATADETRNKLTYDLYYVKHASPILDLWILLLTAKAIVAGTSSR